MILEDRCVWGLAFLRMQAIRRAHIIDATE